MRLNRDERGTGRKLATCLSLPIRQRHPNNSGQPISIYYISRLNSGISNVVWGATHDLLWL
jgi:hypothetical protein